MKSEDSSLNFLIMEDNFETLLNPDSLSYEQYKENYVNIFPFIVVNHRFNENQFEYQILQRIGENKEEKWVLASSINENCIIQYSNTIEINLIDMYWKFVNTFFNSHIPIQDETIVQLMSNTVISSFSPDQMRMESRETFKNDQKLVKHYAEYLQKRLQFF